MNPEQLEALWERGQRYEDTGALDAAREAYLEILAGSPRQFMVQLRLSELEQRAGCYRAAHRHALGAAETLSLTRRWEGLAFVTSNLLVFDDRQVVLDLIRQAAWDDQRVIAQSPVLSQQLWLCGDPQAALRMLDRVVGHVAPDHRLSYSRAMALQYLGRIDEATEEFEQSLRIAPTFPLAHWSLAYHAPSTPRGARVPRIRAALAGEMDPLERAMLQYALYKELDDAGQHDAAWAALIEGARIMHGLQGYSAGASQPDVDALLKAKITRSVSAEATRSELSPIFIVGLPRTGTTLLSRIIGAHPDVADAGELNALENAISDQLDRFVDLPLRSTDVAATQGAGIDVAREYMERTQSYYVDGKSRLIDKNPLNVFAAGLIAEGMPNARILCLVREPMDACYSNFRQLFQNGAFSYSYDLLSLAERYAEFHRVVNHWEEKIPENFHTIRYENLVKDPLSAARDAMEFCGLEFNPAYVDITKNLSPSYTASSSQIRDPIHASGMGAWRAYEDYLQPLAARLRELHVPI